MFKKALIAALALIGTKAVSLQNVDGEDALRRTDITQSPVETVPSNIRIPESLPLPDQP